MSQAGGTDPGDIEFEQRYERLPGPARELLDTWLATEPEAGTETVLTGDPAGPRTAAEALLVQVWQEVLGRDRIGVEEDYYDVGGDSIRAIVIVARAEAAGLRVGTRDLLEVRTIRALAVLGEPVGDHSDAVMGPGPVPRTDVPLTALQQGMLFHTLAAGQGAYLAQVGCDLIGDLDPRALQAAWQCVVDRHSALRSTFHWSGDAPPVRRVAGTVTVDWVEKDLRGLQPLEQHGRLREYSTEIINRRFDLGVAPLLRLGLFRTADTAHRFVLAHHHLLLDGWSQHLVLSDVLTAYAALLAGEKPRLPERGDEHTGRYRQAGGQSRDDADGRLEGGNALVDDAAQFWRQELDGIAFEPAPDPIQTSHASETAFMTIPCEVMADADRYCRSIGVTLALAVQAGWAVSVSRPTSIRSSSGIPARPSGDVVVGVTTSGRSTGEAGLADAVGMFINTVPMRVSYTATDRLHDWLATLHRRRVRALDREHDSLTQIARWVGLTGPNTLFETIVVVENFPSAGQLEPPPGLQIENVTSTIDEGYPLVLEVRELSNHSIQAGDGNTQLVLRSDPDRFAREDCDRFLIGIATFMACLAAETATGPEGQDPPSTMGDLASRIDSAVKDRAASRRADLHVARGLLLGTESREPISAEDR